MFKESVVGNLLGKMQMYPLGLLGALSWVPQSSPPYKQTQLSHKDYSLLPISSWLFGPIY